MVLSVPNVYEKFKTESIPTTGYASGDTIDKALYSGDQNERKQIGRIDPPFDDARIVRVEIDANWS